jgi:hypothetical protein
VRTREEKRREEKRQEEKRREDSRSSEEGRELRRGNNRFSL